MGFFDTLFSNKHEKTPLRKADSPLIIHYPMQESDHKKAAFQNIVVAIKADNALAETQKERLEKWGIHNGLLIEEVQIVWHQADKLAFVQHDKPSWNHLDIRMMADYAVQSEKVYAKALSFAEEVGVQAFMFAQLFSGLGEGVELEKQKAENLAVYYAIQNQLKAENVTDRTLAKIVRDVKQSKDFVQNYSSNEATNSAIYRFLWLVFLHCAWLDKDLVNSLTGICMSIEAGRENMEVIWQMLRAVESNFGKQKLPVLSKTEKELKAELALFWK